MSACDPHVEADQAPDGIELVDFGAEALGGADAVVLLVDHDAFDLDLVASASKFVLDTRAVVPAGPTVERL